MNSSSTANQAAVHRAALAAVGSPADADDVAQDAFLLAYRRLRSFRGQATFKTWLLTITWNQAINHRRKSARWWRQIAPSGEGPEFDATPVASLSSSPEDLASHRQLRDDIRQAIRRLPPKLRDTFLLAQSGEHSYEQIATILDTQSGTIKWRVSEARRLIRQRLDEHRRPRQSD